MMLKTFLVTIAAAALLGASGEPADIISDQMEASGAYELGDSLPDETVDALDELGIELAADGIGSPSPEKLIELIAQSAADAAKGPAGACAAALGIIIIGSAAAAVTGKRSEGSMGLLTSAAVCAVICLPAAKGIDLAASAVSGACKFSAALVPVLASLTAAAGHVSSAAAYSVFTLTMTEGLTLLTSGVLVPGVRVLLGVSAAAALAPSLNTEALTGAAEKGIKWLLGLAGVLFSGTLGVSTITAAASDGVANKIVRFAVSGFVPVVGGALGDALASVRGCVGIVRSSVGAFGMAAGMMIFLPSLLNTIMWKLSLDLTAWAAKALGGERPAAFMRSLSSALSILLALIVFSAALVVSSVAIIIRMGGV